MNIPAVELQSFFAAIERGEIRLTALDEPQDIYAGNVRYRASNGWTLVIFNDCNEYDYVDEVRTDGGAGVGFDELDGTRCDWKPDDETAWRCLGIPGYCGFRCIECGAQLPNALERKAPVEPPFLCGGDGCAGKQSPRAGSWVKPVVATL